MAAGVETESLDEPLERIMVKAVVTVDVNATVAVAASLMAKEDCGCLVVLFGRRPTGIITERDIVRKVVAEGVDPSRVLVRHIMSTPLIVAAPKESIRQAAERMSVHQVRRLVVTDDRGTLVGLITASDLAKWLAGRSHYTDPSLIAIARMKRISSPYA